MSCTSVCSKGGGGGTLGFVVLTIFLRYFGYFNLELRYSPNLRDAVFCILDGMKNYLSSPSTFPSLFQFTIVSFLLNF